MKLFRSAALLSVLVVGFTVSSMAMSLQVPEGVNASGFDDGSDEKVSLESQIESKLDQREEKRTDIKKEIERKLQQKEEEIKKKEKNEDSGGFISDIMKTFFG